MAQIDVPRHVLEQVSLLSAAWGTSHGETVERLVRDFQNSRQQPQSVKVDNRIRIYATYKGSRTEGLFDPASEVVEITSGPLAGKRYKSPSAAGAAVVQAANPRVSPNRNGWAFWACADSGQILQMVRRQP